MAQPTDESCGPTCLQAVYNYYGDSVKLERLIQEVKQVGGGGTLAVMLGNHALKRGYTAHIYTYNLHVFDPTWFQPNINISEKLKKQFKSKNSHKLKDASKAYLQFLALGGQICFQELDEILIKSFLDKNVPILTGLSATYLYKSAREMPIDNSPDDINGYPVGHFVIISGFDKRHNKVLIADPLNPNPIQKANQYYHVDLHRLINAILLGIVTYDANLLIIQPK